MCMAYGVVPGFSLREKAWLREASVRAEEVRQRDVIIYSLTHVRERNANLEARSRARVVGQGTKRRC